MTTADDRIDGHGLESLRFSALREARWEDAVALLHPDLRYVHANGATDDRDAYAGQLLRGFCEYSGVEHTNDRVDVLPGVVLTWGSMRGPLRAGDAVRQLDSTTVTVWARSQWQWLLLSALGSVHPRPKRVTPLCRTSQQC
jgi:hypothetical protein